MFPGKEFESNCCSVEQKRRKIVGPKHAKKYLEPMKAMNDWALTTQQLNKKNFDF